MRIRLVESSQSKKVFSKSENLFEDNRTIKDTEMNIQLKTGTLPGETKTD